MPYPYRYGEDLREAAFPASWDLRTLRSEAPAPAGSDEDVVARALDHPVSSPPLQVLASGNPRTLVVVGDRSRAWQRPSVFLPPLLDRLVSGGVDEARITLLVATGTHRPHTDEQNRALFGSAICDRFRVESHDCLDRDRLVRVGESPAGHPVLINRRVTEAECLVVTGAVTFHGLAGFSGGPKSIVPGVAGYETIQANHRICLDPEGRLKEEVRHGVTLGNPVAEDMAGAAGLVRIHFLMNVLVGDGGHYLAAAAGEPGEAHRRCCTLARSFLEAPLDRRADLVVASVGGHPRDAELFQSVKALSQAADAALPGGTVILASRCGQGMGPPDFLEWFRLGSREHVVERLKRDFTIPGFVALKMHELAGRNRLILVSDLAPDLARLCPVEPASSLEEALDRAGAGLDPGARVIWMPSAATTVPVISETKEG